MQKLTYENVLLKTAFCIMACDGSIDSSEVEVLKRLCAGSSTLSHINYDVEITNLMERYKNNSKTFISNYINAIDSNNFNDSQQLEILYFAYETIMADNDQHYSEVKLFKKIRSHMNISDGSILSVYPHLDSYLQPDAASHGASSFKELEDISRLFNDFTIPKLDVK